MQTRKIAFKSFDNKQLNLVQWKPNTDQEIRGVLQVIHGMAEHILRYEELARFFCENGFVVYGHDQRGHGKSLAKDDVIGFIADENGWDIYLQDVHAVNEFIVDENPKLPIFILGHSMGAIVASAYRQKYDNPHVKGYILSALAFEQGFLSKLGIGVASVQKLFQGKISPAKIHNSLSFDAFNKPFKPNRTAFDWLSKDDHEVDKYVSDEYCGAVFTVQFFDDLLHGLIGIYKKENLEKINKNIPVFFLAGTDDPVSGGTKKFNQTKALLEKYTDDVTTKLYPEGRHEMLHETNRKEVMQDILDWVIAKL